MDKSQIEEYAEFIKRNKAEKAVLGCFCYLDTVNQNNYEKVISVFSKNFELIGFSEFGFDRLKKGGFVAGRMYLFNTYKNQNTIPIIFSKILFAF